MSLYKRVRYVLRRFFYQFYSQTLLKLRFNSEENLSHLNKILQVPILCHLKRNKMNYIGVITRKYKERFDELRDIKFNRLSTALSRLNQRQYLKNRFSELKSYDTYIRLLHFENS